jgi:hypothetical protein
MLKAKKHGPVLLL